MLTVFTRTKDIIDFYLDCIMVRKYKYIPYIFESFSQELGTTKSDITISKDLQVGEHVEIWGVWCAPIP